MTHSEVINGLKCCNSSKDLCFKCPYIKFGDNCSIKLRKDALKLIKKQQAEIDRLTNYNQCIDAQCRDLLDKEETIKIEAIKEFSEKLNTEIRMQYHSRSIEAGAERNRIIKIIDNLVKEFF